MQVPQSHSHCMREPARWCSDVLVCASCLRRAGRAERPGQQQHQYGESLHGLLPASMRAAFESEAKIRRAMSAASPPRPFSRNTTSTTLAYRRERSRRTSRASTGLRRHWPFRSCPQPSCRSPVVLSGPFHSWSTRRVPERSQRAWDRRHSKRAAPDCGRPASNSSGVTRTPHSPMACNCNSSFDDARATEPTASSGQCRSCE